MTWVGPAPTAEKVRGPAPHEEEPAINPDERTEDGVTNDTPADRLDRGSPWVPVPLWLLGIVSDSALVTWLAIAAHVNARSATAWPGVPLLATERGVNERTIQRHLRELEAAGALSSTSTRRPDGSTGTNTYRLATAPPVDEPVDDPVHKRKGGGTNVTGGVA